MKESAAKCVERSTPSKAAQTFRYYMEFLHQMQDLAIRATGEWDRTQAASLVRYHARKLLEVRQISYDRKRLIFGTYVYFRNAKAKGFTDTAVLNSLWKQVGTGPAALSSK